MSKNFGFDTDTLRDLEEYLKHESNKGKGASEVVNEALSVYLKRELKKLNKEDKETEESSG